MNLVFHKEWFDKLNEITNEEKRNAFTWALVYYSFTGELKPTGDEFADAWLKHLAEQVDYSHIKYQEKIDQGKTSGRKPSYNENEMIELVRQGLKAQEIADKLGMTRDAVYKTPIWKNRNQYK